MLDLTVLAGVGVAVCSIFLLFACLCHLFKKSQAGFSTFENEAETGQGQGFSIYTSQNVIASQQDTSQVTFEPLPDILAKTVTATALRPRISCIDREKQRNSAKHITVYRPFPRSQLMYIKEIGLGWFGQVLLGDAERIHVSSKKTRVVVKHLKDDASLSEQQLFLEEMAAYREIEHPNIIQLMGQCTESSPFLVILEHSPYGDLKSYLRQQKNDSNSATKYNILIDFMIDVSAGLACLHRHGYLHHDFSCRNCLVMSDLHVKVGDYGVAEDHFREDYYDTGQDLLPVRWMAPESLQLVSNIWQVKEFTSVANIWALGITLWEISEYCERPYDAMSDEQVLQQVVRQRTSTLSFQGTKNPIKAKLNEIMRCCWAEDDHRPTAETTHSYLKRVREDIQTKEVEEQCEFDAKWDRASVKDTCIRPKKSCEQISMNSDSVHVQIVDSEETISGDLIKESPKYVHIEPKIIVSNSTPKKSAMSGEKAKVHQAGKFSTDTSVIPMEPESVNDLPVSFHQQKLQAFGDNVFVLAIEGKASKTSEILVDKSNSVSGEEELTRRPSYEVTEDVKYHGEDINSNVHVHASASKENFTHINSKSGMESKQNIMKTDSPNSSYITDGHQDDSVILSGSGNIDENFNLSATENISPLPSNTATPSKRFSTVQLTSTPAPKPAPAEQQEVVTSDYLTASNNQTTQNTDGTKFFTAENTPEKGDEKKHQQRALYLENEMRTDNKVQDSEQEKCIFSEDSAIFASSVKSVATRKELVPPKEEDRSADLYKDTVIDKDLSEREKERREGVKSGSESSIEDENEEDRDSSEEEKLKILKMRLTDALSVDSEENNKKVRHDKNSGDESPVKDELEIAREIYMSKGTTIPPTTHTTPRSLNTIPEDDIPLDSNLPATHIPTNGDSVLSTPTKQALKFDDPSEEFSGTVSEPFEWDDYISDDLQLVGDVKYSESSPRQTMEFPEWSLDNDSSSQESDSKVLNKANADSSASSTTESRLGTPYSTSESEEYDSDNELSDDPKGDSGPSKRMTEPKAISEARKSYKSELLSPNTSTESEERKAYTESQVRTAPTKPPRIKLTKPSFEENTEEEKN